MADNVNKELSVRKVFIIPDWYEISKFEMDKLYAYLLEASSAEEANWFRFLDCSAFCREELCFFCSGNAKKAASAERN